jgi:hypothetical protein
MDEAVQPAPAGKPGTGRCPPRREGAYATSGGVPKTPPLPAGHLETFLALVEVEIRAELAEFVKEEFDALSRTYRIAPGAADELANHSYTRSATYLRALCQLAGL